MVIQFVSSEETVGSAARVSRVATRSTIQSTAAVVALPEAMLAAVTPDAKMKTTGIPSPSEVYAPDAAGDKVQFRSNFDCAFVLALSAVPTLKVAVLIAR